MMHPPYSPLLVLLALLLPAFACGADTIPEQPTLRAPAPPLTPAEQQLFQCRSYGHHRVGMPEWREDLRVLHDSQLSEDEAGNALYIETLHHISEDGLLLTTLTRSAKIGTAGFTYSKEQRQALQPYVFPTEEADQVEVWQMHERQLCAVTRRSTQPGAKDERELWRKPQPPPHETSRALIRIRERKNPQLSDLWPDPTPDPRYAFSPDGKQMVYAFENSSGAISYIFNIFTREGEEWVQEEHTQYFGSRFCGLDYTLTNEGIRGIVIDDELELRFEFFLPYMGKDPISHWYRADSETYATPLVEAAYMGQLEVVRALLTSPKVDPGAVNCFGEDATMITKEMQNPNSWRFRSEADQKPEICARDAEIIALVRRARGEHYDRTAALNKAIAYWKGVQSGAIEAYHHGSCFSYIYNLLEAKEKWLLLSAEGKDAPQSEELLRTRAERLACHLSGGYSISTDDMLRELQELSSCMSTLCQHAADGGTAADREALSALKQSIGSRTLSAIDRALSSRKFTPAQEEALHHLREKWSNLL